MSSENPYHAPSAALGVPLELLEGDLAAAVEDFIITRRFVRVVAGLSALFLVVALVGYAVSMAAATATALSERAVALLTILLMYGVTSVFLYRLSSALNALAENKTWENVTRLFQRMTQTWMAGIITLVLALVGGIAVRFTGPLAALAVTHADVDSNTVEAARHLRNTLRILVLLTVLGGIGNIVLTVAFPTPAQAMLGREFLIGSMLGGLIGQALILGFMWRHVPALDAFIAAPSATTLAKVARAHRILWRVVLIFVWILIAVAIIGILAAITIPVMSKHAVQN